MHRALVFLLLAAVLTAAETGKPAPGLAAATWVRGAAPASTQPIIYGVWEGSEAVEAGLDLLHATAAKHGDKVHAALLVVATADEARAALATVDDDGVPVAAIAGEARIAWLGESEAPMVVAVGGDGMVLWTGQPSEAEEVIVRIAAGTFDPAVAAKVQALHHDVETIMEADAGEDGREAQFAKADAKLVEILALDPIDQRALHLRLAIARERDDRPGHAAVLAAIPVGRLPAAVANQLAWDLVIDEDLKWRRLGPALNLARRACAADPGESAYQDTLARVTYALGLIDEAIAIQLKAVSLAPDEEGLQATLEFYREAKMVQAAYQAAEPPAIPPALPLAPALQNAPVP